MRAHLPSLVHRLHSKLIVEVHVCRLTPVRPDEGYFDLSETGRVTVLDDGRVPHETDAGGLHQYLIVDDEQRARIKEALIYLASQPPDAARRD